MSAPGGSPLVSKQAALVRELHAELLERMDLRRTDLERVPVAELRRRAALHLDGILMRRGIGADQDPLALKRFVLDETLGFGALEPLLCDDSITEVMINGPEHVFVERQGRVERVPMFFSSEEALRGIVERIIAPLGRRLDEASPMVDARLPDGSRVNVVIPPLAIGGTAVTVRRFGRRRLDARDLVTLGSVSENMLRFLATCIEFRRNVVVSGGTGSGKTTLLNVLSTLIRRDERVVTIEDAAELAIDHPNHVALEARPRNVEGRGEVTIRDLVRNALRMRPDRIVVGECRGGEALDMLQAMNTGHDGSLTTVHANSPRDALSRLEVMTLMSGLDLPLGAIREQLASAVHIIVQQQRFSCGARRVVEIAEVVGMESGRIQMQPLFRHVASHSGTAGQFTGCGWMPAFVERLPAGSSLPAALFAEAGS